MSLDALAPDQRAVVQLVLQQDRSYEELAGLLGISADAVRDRAHKGLERLGGSGLDAGERADVSDYLLGQQSVSGREAARALLQSSPAAREWAREVSAELEGVARTPLPPIPDDAPATAIADTATGGVGVAAAGREPAAEEEAPARDPDPEPAVRARPRPRPDRERPARERPAARERAKDRQSAAAAATTTAAATPTADAEPGAGAPRVPDLGDERSARPRSNLLGGALLIGGLAIVLVALVIWLVNRDGGDDGGTTKAGATPTATATAEGEFQQLGGLNLTATGGGKAKGQLVLFANQNGGIAFTVQGTDVPPSREGEAYAIWLTGGKQPHRLGFAPQVGEDGKFGTSGPREQDAEDFAQWFSEAKRVVVSRERTEDAREPGPIVMQGRIPTGQAGAGADSGG